MEDPVTASLGPMGLLLRRLHSFQASEHSLPEGLSADGIRLLKEGLEGLYHHLKDVAETDLDPSLTPKWWIKEVRELSYDTEDFFDKVMQSGAGDDVVVHRSPGCTTIFPIGSKRKQRRLQVIEDFSQLMARVDDAGERCQSFELAPEIHVPELSLDLPVLTAPTTDVQVDNAGCSIVGVEESMKKLVNLMAFGDVDQKQLKVVPIFGSAGVGKTTFARTIYHQYGWQFQCRAFIRVSRNPDIRWLLTSILSQIKAPQTHAFSDAQDLIDSIMKHLQGKRYFIIVDDLWTASVWDIISRAFPYGDFCSRILTNTQIEDVALACSGYEPEYIFKMGPLNDGDSRKLFFNIVGSEGGCPKEFEIVADRIIRKCGGLPLSIINIASLLLPSKANHAIEQWVKIESSLRSTLTTNSTSQGMKDVLIFIYNKLPLHLKSCLLYLSMYPEGYTIRKDDLVKQWVGECFVGDFEHSCFDELIRRGMIQPVDTNYHGEVLSCTVNHMVLDFIRHKSVADNFIIPVNYFGSTLELPDKVRRLSVQFGGAKSVKIPESIRMSQVRSLLYCGFSRFVPSIQDYELLRVLILHIWADQNQTSFDLTRISELFRLRYLKVQCNIAVNLPDKIQGLRHLEALQIDGRLSAIPTDIGHLEKLRVLRLPSQANVRDLVGLTNLQDLHLTHSTVQPRVYLEDNMKYMGSILEKLSNLKSVILASAGSYPVNAVSVYVSCHGLSNLSPALANLERLELLPRSCIFSSLPKWFKTLAKLYTLKIAVRELSNSDTDIIKGLPALSALSLYIHTTPTKRIVFGKAGFSALKYFKLRCSQPLLKFEADAMPSLRKLKLVFNAQLMQQHGAAPICIEHLAGLREISAKIVCLGAVGTESALFSVSNDPKNPKIKEQLVNWNFCAGEDSIIEEQDEILEENTEYEYKGEDANRQPDSGSAFVIEDEEQVVILGENTEYEYKGEGGNRQPDSGSAIVIEEQDVILEENTEYEYKGEDGNRQPDSGIFSPALPQTHPGRRYWQRRLVSAWARAWRASKARPWTTSKSAREGRNGLLWWRNLVPCNTGMFSRSSGKDGSRLSACSSRASSASMPPSAKTECEILQSANVKVFSYNDLRSATRNFRPDSVLGEGGFGSVYKGWIDEHTLSACKPGTGIPVAVKRLNQEGLQGHREWLAEVNYLGQFCHPNLVKLIGYCLEDEYRLLVYECMPRGSLENHLFRRGSRFQPLSWNLRMKVALGAAKGLAYLHSAEAKVIYRDFKTSNILLDTDYTAKLSDFGLAKDGPVGEKSHVSTRVMGTYGYAAPEYLSTGHLTAKSDIYSFGVVLLEMLSGRRAIDKNRPQGEHNLVEWARPYLTHKRKIFRVLDTRLEGQYSLSGAQTIAALAVECLKFESKMRPSMDAVVSILEGIQDSSDPTRKPAADRHQDPKKMTSASVGRNSGKPRRKSSNDLQKEAGRDPKTSVLHST